ncbi:transglycosylase SLT domain-containing protein [Nocardioides sp. BP30]|uniref:transglycosylase SLT domain-containing protein n=1 Tax=Nocardioides sp. BP30 TaxID=3036374 RepID=UPI0024688125|nr:transglycosylase SLT domain-containing protein [Nocardioides sp. BP30]WGL51957.1 transglycosylase SLT domain-containing protein [Nocardioides sp. BP30]
MSSMTVEASGLSEISSRIEQIQSQLAALSGTTTTAATTDTTSSDFSTALRAATTSTGTASTGLVATNDGTSIAPPPGYGTSSGATGSDVVTDARRYLGVPYLWGGTDPSKGLDCSGLVQQVYGDLGIDLPRVSRDQAGVGTSVGSLADAQPGDLLFFGSPIYHVAIYEGDGMMIEAPHTGQSVKEIKVADFGEPVSKIQRVLGTSADTSARVPALGATATAGGSSGVGSATPYASVINAAAARTGVPADLIAAVAKQESGFNASAVSRAGAEGIMQLMPATAKGLGVTDPLDATQSINGGADYLASLLKRFGGSTTLAVAAYNAGPGAVLKYGGVPPYAETQSYVRNVLALTEAT